jgi:hypothetical protein
MGERAGSPETWQAIKQHLVKEKRWSELIY